MTEEFLKKLFELIKKRAEEKALANSLGVDLDGSRAFDARCVADDLEKELMKYANQS